MTTTDLRAGDSMQRDSVGDPFSVIVQAIRAGDDDAFLELYNSFGWLRPYFARWLGPQEADDLYHDVILAVLTAIRAGGLRDVERLPGFVRATAHNMVGTHVRRAMSRRAVDLPGEHASDVVQATQSDDVIQQEKQRLARVVVKGLPAREREVLIRFYLDEDDPGTICADLGLTETQFRVVKSRAKARLAARVRNRLASTQSRD